MMGRIAIALGFLGLVSNATAASPDDVNVRKMDILPTADEHLAEAWQPCESCEWAVRSVQDYVANPQHRHKLAALLDSVACTFVPEDVKEACDNKVEAAVKHAVQMFEDYVSPASVCKPICPEASLLDHTFHHPRYPECSKCEFLAAELANNVEDKGDGHTCMCKSCSKLPDPFVEECMGFVQWNGQSLVQFTETYGQEQACQNAGLCDVPEITEALARVPVPEQVHDSAAHIASLLGAAQAKSLIVGDKETCEFCRLAVMELRDKISDPQFQHEVETYAKTICKSLGDYRNMCIQYVDEYAPIAFALAEDYLEPRSVCGVLHMCPVGPPPTE